MGRARAVQPNPPLASGMKPEASPLKDALPEPWLPALSPNEQECLAPPGGDAPKLC